MYTDMIIRSKNNTLYLVCFKIQDSFIFKALSIICIFGNAVTLALSSHPEDLDREKIVEYLNLIFSGFFMIELLIKLVG
jgi:Ion transport protein